MFIAEKPEPAAYKNYWEDEAPKKKEEEGKGSGEKEEEKKDSKEEDKPPVVYLDEKYKYIDDFGETLIGKKRPALFVFDIIENTINEVVGIDQGVYPTFPIFDETNKSIIYAGIKSPIMKLGMNFCLNRDTKLYHLRDPVFDKKNLPAEGYVTCLNPT